MSTLLLLTIAANSSLHRWPRKLLTDNGVYFSASRNEIWTIRM